MKIRLYTILAWLCDLLSVEHNFRRRIGGIVGARTRRSNKNARELQELFDNCRSVNAPAPETTNQPGAL